MQLVGKQADHAKRTCNHNLTWITASNRSSKYSLRVHDVHHNMPPHLSSFIECNQQRELEGLVGSHTISQKHRHVNTETRQYIGHINTLRHKAQKHRNSNKLSHTNTVDTSDTSDASRTTSCFPSSCGGGPRKCQWSWPSCEGSLDAAIGSVPPP